MKEVIAEKIIKESNGDETVVYFMSYNRHYTRFAENRITQNMARDVTEINIEVHFGTRKGSAATTSLNYEDIKNTLKRAEQTARHAPEDPEYVPPLEPVKIKNIERFYEETLNLTPENKALSLRKVFSSASRHGVKVAGLYTNGEREFAVYNSRGHEAYHKSSEVSFSITVQGEDSSGYTAFFDENIERLDLEKEYEGAFKKQELGKNPKEVEPGIYKVIIEPVALSNLLLFLYMQMDARAADEGRSFFSGKIGEKIFNELVNLYIDPYSKVNPAIPFDGEGFPLGYINLIDRGVVKSLICDRYWAKKTGRKPTGRPFFFNMDDGQIDVEDLIKEVDRGILVTRFWYIRYVDQKSITVTGMTRDGTFMIEDGKIAYGTKNMRFNESVVNVLKNVLKLGKGKRVGVKYWGSDANYIPIVLVSEFNFSSKTKF